MDEQPVLDRIERLVEEEHALCEPARRARLTDAEHKRLHAVRRELDGAYDALRLRRAGGDRPPPDSEIPGPPDELEAPDPEPPLQHGVHEDEPSPDPGINPNAP